jgi:hypothetical protein
LRVQVSNEGTTGEAVAGSVVVSFPRSADGTGETAVNSDNAITFDRLRPGEQRTVAVAFTHNQPGRWLPDTGRPVPVDIQLMADGVACPTERIRLAIAAREIDYPVAIDNDYGVWSAFANHYWPALYFIDRDGMIRDQHFGEGRYKQSERAIQHLLGVERDLTPVEGTGPEAEADWDNLRTPETYVGDARRERRSTAADRLNHWALNGEWRSQAERVVAQEPGASIAFRFHARDAHAVLSPGPRDPIPFRVTLDGEAPGEAHGVDADAEGNGELREGRMYQLIRQPGAIRDRTLELTFSEPGAEAYSFTFG